LEVQRRLARTPEGGVVTVVLALVSAALGGSADFMGGSASRRLPVMLVVGASQACSLGLLAVLIAATRTLHLGSSYLGPAAVSGVLMLIGLVSFYAALAAGTMSIVAPIAALGVGFPLGWSLLHGETPSTGQFLGICIAIIGVVLASGPEMKRPAGLRPLMLAALAAFGFGSSMLFYSQAARSDTVMSLLVMKAVILLPFLALLWRQGAPRVSRGWPLSRAQLALLTATGTADLGANLCFGIAASRGLVSIVSVLGSLYPVATVLLARWVHAERMSSFQRCGVLATLGGVVLISAG
jgi:drug/metabolite transporter (DMT)-like permease